MSAETIIIKSVGDVMEDYSTYVMGLLGVVHDGEDVIRGAKEALGTLKHEKKSVVFLSNTPLRSAEMADRLAGIGIDESLYDGLLTSGEIAYHELKNRIDPIIAKFGETYYTIGQPSRVESLVSAGYTPVKKIDDASFILLTGPFSDIDSIDMYNDLLAKALKRHLPMICTNPSRTRKIKNEIQITAGYIGAKYERNGGMVIYKGKPDPSLYAYCFEGVGEKDRKKCLVIGNNYETDILPADKGGYDNMLVGGGHHKKELKGFTKTDINDLSRHFGVYPTYAIKELVI